MFVETSQSILNASLYTAHEKHPYAHTTPTTMATEFAMPVQQFTSSPSSAQFTIPGAHSQQISPVDSATATPSNHSPTSPRTSFPSYLPQGMARQLRTPRSPLYVPAVLRPTDAPRRPVKSSPLTPPHSKHNSFDDAENIKALSRRSTGDSGKFGLGAITEAEWSTEGLGRVTGPPSRGHWKEDQLSEVCDDTACTRYFSYFTRRHHCRRCGNIFCDSHSNYMIPLDQDANYHPRGVNSRACHHCWNDYNTWQMARFSRSNSDTSVSDLPDIPSTPTVECAVNKGMRGAMGSVFGQKNQGTPESLGASVPRDWHWSTF
ncbi:FYVE-type zinc finger-containing protein C9B6.03 [Phlyctema vagabunda]|uniref:FYVE-type zinc finger-containing protein C9B6.03 n=1 Tax=Phlyctema vagabunda TaxID=108571 RepID=A0ABR4PN55_9HELO